MKTKEIMAAIIVVVILIVALLVEISRYNTNENTINHWVESQNDKVQSIDRPAFDHGPYWITKHKHIFKVVTTNNIIYWFRFGFSGDPEIFVERNGKYGRVQ